MKKYRLLILCLVLNVNAAEDKHNIGDKTFPLYFDKEMAERKRHPLSTKGDYAKAISLAYDYFSENHMNYEPDKYIVSVVEVKECYLVQFYIPITKIGTGSPYEYCVIKEDFKVSEVNIRKCLVIRYLE